jgi:hypothetical protein
MKKLSTLKLWSLCWFSKPVEDRVLYKRAIKDKPQSITEIGLASLARTQTLIQIAQQGSAGEVRYHGVDLFEGREKPIAGLTLRDAHRTLSATGAKVRVLPGECQMVITRQANQLGTADLLVISNPATSAEFENCWFFLPRLLTENGRLYLRHLGSGELRYQILERAEVEQLANRVKPSLQRAA